MEIEISNSSSSCSSSSTGQVAAVVVREIHNHPEVSCGVLYYRLSLGLCNCSS